MAEQQEYRNYGIAVNDDGTCMVETQDGDIPFVNVQAAHQYIDRRIANLPKPWWFPNMKRRDR